MADAPQDARIILKLKSDDSPEVAVSGSKEEVIRRLKLMIKELQNKPAHGELDKKLLKALHEAIEEIAKITPPVIGNLHVDKPGNPEDRKVIVIRSIVTDHPSRKPLSNEQKAEIEKLQTHVKKLNAELQAKQKELMEAQAKLSMLGADDGTPRALFLRGNGKLFVKDGVTVTTSRPKKTEISADSKAGVKKLMGAAKSAYADGRYVECEALAKKVLEIDPNETAASILASKARTERRFRQDQADQKKPVIIEDKVTRTVKPQAAVIGKIERVNPKDRRVEITIGSHDGLVQGDELKLFTDHPAKGKAPSDQQRIEELESRLKKLLDEVDSLKQERAKESIHK